MLKRFQTFIAIFILALITVSYATGAEAEGPVRASLISEAESIEPGRPFWVAIRLELDDQWHAYWKNPGDAGMPPQVEWELPEGFSAGELLWPHPHKMTLNGSVSFGYQDEVILLSKITPPKELANEKELAAEIRWVVCDDTSCLPGGAKVKAAVSPSAKTPVKDPKYRALFERARAQIPKPLAGAEAKKEGGLITLILEAEEEFLTASFFPELPDQIDHTVDPYLTKADGEKNRIRIHLKESENANQTDPLKGVVLLKRSPAEDSFLAYEVDLPLISEKEGRLAFQPEIQAKGETKLEAAAEDEAPGFFLALALAFAGGMLLNLMPCVLPVISFKVLSFVKMAGQSRSLTFKHGLAFSLGVVISFWALAGVLLGMQAYGHAVGWGFQLQEPWFVAALASIILLFSLSMFGVFELGTGVAGKAGHVQTKSKTTGLSGSFFSGVLATAVATPCTGPFLGTAVGFAVTLPPVLALLIFSALGIGMASPYLLLGAFPGLLRFMPKPGNWMVTFKEVTGFVMLATVLWLVWVFGAETGTMSLFFLLTAFFFMAVGCWILGKWGTPIKKRAIRNASYLASVAFLGLGAYLAFIASTLPPTCLEEGSRTGNIAMADHEKTAAHAWEAFSPERVEELRRQGIPVFIDFTAKWCLICQANHLVLSLGEVEKKFDELGVVRMKADWTKSSPVITEELKKYGRNSVPLYLLYGTDPTAKAEILPQVLTPEIVIDYLDKLKGQMAKK